MAFGSVQTKNGNWVNGGGYNAFRAVLYYAVNSEATKVTFNSQLVVQSGEGHDSLSNFTLKLNGKSKSSSAYLSAGATVKVASENGIVVTRNKTTQSKTLSSYATGGSWSGSSEAKVTISIDPLPSYAVTYNANGGTGAPTSQTKWYNESLSLKGWGTASGTTPPTRANYTFLGWSTSSTATSATYTSSSHSYTGNAPLTLYAVWELAFVAPTLSKLTAFRSDSSGTSDPSSTSYIHVDVTWSVDTAATPGNKGRTVAVTIKSGSTQVASGSSTVSTTSGTTSFTLAPTTSGDTFSGAYIVNATITDTNNQTATKTTSVSVVFKPFTMTNAGLSAAFFGIAQSTWNRILKVFGNVRIQEDSFTESTTPSSNVYGRGVYLTDANDADVGYVRAMKLTNGQQGTQIETRRIISGTNKYNTLNLLLDNSGNPVVNISAPARPLWFGQVATWTRFADFASGTSTTISIPAAANEILVFARCTNTVAVDGVNVRRYSGTVLIPKGLIDTTSTEWILGGGSVGSTSSGSGTRYCAIRLTTTKAIGVGAYCDGTNYQSSTHFWMYWR